MSIKLMSAIFETEMHDLPYTKDGEERKAKASTAKLLLLALADHANDYGESAYPGYSRLEIKTCLSRQGISDTIEALKHNGILTISDTPSRIGTNNYTINIRCFPAMEKEAAELPQVVKPLDQQESSHLTRVVKPLDHNHPLTTNKPSLGENPSPIVRNAELSIENQIAIGVKEVTLPQDQSEMAFFAECEIATMNVSKGAANIAPLCMAFLKARHILPTKKEITGWRAAFLQMHEKKVRAEHITPAVRQLLKAHYTVSDPYAIIKTAVNLANPAPNTQLSTHRAPVMLD